MTNKTLEPIVVNTIWTGKTYLELKEPLILQSEFDEDCDLFFAGYNELYLYESASSYYDLAKEVDASLTFMWVHYAMAEDSELEGEAIELKNRLLNMVEG